MDIESPKPTIVLVHGALEDASIWHLVIPRLQRDGYPVIAFANPLQSLSIDVAHLRSRLDKIEGPVILVSHAYGGAVITQAGDDPKVKGLVYAASPAPAVGESATTCLERFPGGDFGSSVDLIPYTLPDGTSGTNVQVKADKSQRFRPELTDASQSIAHRILYGVDDVNRSFPPVSMSLLDRSG
jgi:pimeloyl-ACP methyl ester carboxylesterase